MRADLHIHTTASDGCWTPERVIEEVKARGIGLFAITDHDSIAHIPIVEKLVRKERLAFLPGAEVSTRLDDQVFHVLAYGFDPSSPYLASLLDETRALLSRTNDEVVERLVAAGQAIDWADYASYDYDRTRGGWKALNFLIDRGLCTGIPDYFDRLLKDLPLPDPPPFPHPADAAAVIREAGGVPILAHPGLSLRRQGVTDETLRPFVEFGIAGLECYSYAHNETTTQLLLDWCSCHNMLITGGSDCHGELVARELGVPYIDTCDLRLGELARFCTTAT